MYKACKIAGNQMKPMVMLVKPGRVVFLFFCLRFEQACPSSHAETERENPSNSKAGIDYYLRQQIQLINKSLPAPLTRKTARGGSKRA